MSFEIWLVATAAEELPPLAAAAQSGGATVVVVAVGGRELAQAASAVGAAKVHWIEVGPGLVAEAYGPAVARLAAEAPARVWLSGPSPAARALLGGAAVAAGAALVGGGTAVSLDGQTVLVERNALDGAVIETLAADGPVAVVWDSNEGQPDVSGSASPVLPVAAPAPLAVERRSVEAAAGADGLASAERVVGVGRGVKARADLAMVEDLARALGAEMACSMPIADDLHWYPEERYVGRSGQKIAPLVYLALGISGEPQHMEGVRSAKAVVAVNNNPEAVIFRTATYGVVADLYEFVPALARALEDS
ncbi:MAG: electron transfer flavoprotein subunit alpha/FixB family protein [Bifidobacteriaceae bacterium]|nr:electron transfer flavoprotein subunit alpha/FixB family protein [Bifidobacteriaceae bacterium]